MKKRKRRKDHYKQAKKRKAFLKKNLKKENKSRRSYRSLIAQKRNQLTNSKDTKSYLCR